MVKEHTQKMARSVKRKTVGYVRKKGGWERRQDGREG